MARRFCPIVGSVVVGFVLLPGCTAVLGMDRATLDEGAGGISPSGGSQVACKEPPSPGCSDCLRNPDKACDTAFGACMADDLCRGSLDDYAQCLGMRCRGDAEACARKLPSSLRNTCVADCATPCSSTNLVSMCELYCGCMSEFCSGHLSYLGDCMAKCEGWDPEVVTCRRDHCEYGKGVVVMGIDHCMHASGEADTETAPVCPSYLQLPLTKRYTPCGSGKETSWACNVSPECCSKKCTMASANELLLDLRRSRGAKVRIEPELPLSHALDGCIVVDGKQVHH